MGNKCITGTTDSGKTIFHTQNQITSSLFLEDKNTLETHITPSILYLDEKKL